MKKIAIGLSAVMLAGLLAGGAVIAQDAAAPAADATAPAADAAAPAADAAGDVAYADDEASMQKLMELGETVYTDNCAACHGAEGEGGGGPALKNSAVAKSRSAVTFQILFGAMDHGMPAFASVLSDEEIAAVATYIRNSWDNEMGIVLPRSVEMRRAVPPEEEAAE